MYQALYRKWRPQVFADVVGQDHITTTLMNEISAGRHSHAYLFTGSRGTGKTTCAKIFAKAVNCKNPVNGDPCNECETCKGIDSGAILDIIEIDAASNNGVDNIRDIRDEANFTPVHSKYRVYIIDEVHMLSAGAFNALLKILEEPPRHVKFVLATTEVHKLPATILSRCKRFDFKRITPEDIAARLQHVASSEGISLDSAAAALIARLADGALRDALSILDQCVSHNKNVTENVVNTTVGLAGKAHLFSLAAAILNKDGSSALEQIGNLHSNSVDMDRLCNELINHFRNIMICKAVKDASHLVICSKEELNEFEKAAEAYTMTYILEILTTLGDAQNNLKKGLDRRIEMEMAVLKLCTSKTDGLVSGATPISAPTPTATFDSTAEPIHFDPTFEQEPTTIVVSQPIVKTQIESIPEPVVEEIPSIEPAYDIPLETAPEPDPPFELESEEDLGPLPETDLFTGIKTTEPKDNRPISELDNTLTETESVLIDLMEDLPAVDSEPNFEQFPILTSENEPAKIPDGPISTNLWNAITREVVSVDKALIGSMSGAKTFKRGNKILIYTENILLHRWATVDPHRQHIVDASLTVLGEELEPAIISELPEENAKPIQEDYTSVIDELLEPTSHQSALDEIDPLDAFLDGITDDRQFSLFIEE
ncbi:MAG: DNA polymerase III subunit gamma/tau [Ruminococcaceae bacterium]|nr:DNA polymerase III subunit gamma/tau [Oscillospiraceae bacterium]